MPPWIGFDLDGTLVDPLPAIQHALARVCPRFGCSLPSWEAITPHIGSGIQGLFLELFPSPERRAQALAAYWQCFGEEGIARHVLYPGIPLLLARLKHQGHRLCVVTVKPAPFARAVAHHLDLGLLFEAIHGSELDSDPHPKAAQMTDLRSQGLLPAEGLFVGDRGEDVRAAHSIGWQALGVTWGYGPRPELEEAGAEVILDSVASLEAWFEQERPGPPRTDAFSLAE